MKLSDFIFVVTLALTTFLGGCQSVPLRSNGALENTAFSLSGRFSLRYEENGTETGTHGQFTYLQSSHLQKLELGSPLGQTLAEITQDNHRAILHIPNQVDHQAIDMADLLRQTFNLSSNNQIPIDYFLDQLIQAYQQKSTLNLQDKINKDNWVMQISSCQTGTGSCQPKRLDIRNQLTDLPQLILLVDPLPLK